MKKILLVSLFVFLAGSAFVTRAAEKLYTGPIADAHAHIGSKFNDVEPSDIIALYKKADVNKAGIFVSIKKAANLREQFPENFIFFTDPYQDKRGDYRLSERKLDELSDMLNSGLVSGVGEFYVSLSSAPFNRKGIELDLLSPEQNKFLSVLNSTGAVLHFHDERVAKSTEIVFQKYSGIKFILAHCGYLSPSRLRELFEQNDNLFADLSLISNNHFARFRSNPPITIKPSEEWKKLMIDFSSRLMVGSDIGATWKRMSYLPDVIKDYRKILGNLPKEAAEAIAYRNFERLFTNKKNNAIN
jgi:hypothetical protein